MNILKKLGLGVGALFALVVLIGVLAGPPEEDAETGSSSTTAVPETTTTLAAETTTTTAEEQPATTEFVVDPELVFLLVWGSGDFAILDGVCETLRFLSTDDRRLLIETAYVPTIWADGDGWEPWTEQELADRSFDEFASYCGW